MKTKEAVDLGSHLADLLQAGRMDAALAELTPLLSERIKFAILGRIGEGVGAGPLEATNAFLEKVAEKKAEGGWVIIGTALRAQLDRDLEGAFRRAREFIIAGDVWYTADILGERVPGPALLAHFEAALAQLEPWREHENRWVRRTIGVAVHFWAKRSRGAAEYRLQAEALLRLLEPMFTEWEMDAVKGVGWGLKTLGRYYPDIATGWLEKLFSSPLSRYRSLMLKKALTFLSEEQRARVKAKAAS
jgi:hypothetical protein